MAKIKLGVTQSHNNIKNKETTPNPIQLPGYFHKRNHRNSSNLSPKDPKLIKPKVKMARKRETEKTEKIEEIKITRSEH